MSREAGTRRQRRPDDAEGEVSVGRRLKAARKDKAMTLDGLAAASGLTKGFLSQIENDKAKPSVAALKRVASALSLRIADLFMQGNDSRLAPPNVIGGLARVVRHDQRKSLRFPGSQAMSYLLTPDLRGKLEVLLSELPPGDDFEYQPFQHDGEEFGLVLRGRYEVTVSDEVFELEAGDSIYYSSHHPHRMRVLGDEPALTLWVVTPPSF